MKLLIQLLAPIASIGMMIGLPGSIALWLFAAFQKDGDLKKKLQRVAWIMSLSVLAVFFLLMTAWGFFAKP